jgi:hypothetical protein
MASHAVGLADARNTPGSTRNACARRPEGLGINFPVDAQRRSARLDAICLRLPGAQSLEANRFGEGPTSYSMTSSAMASSQGVDAERLGWLPDRQVSMAHNNS